MLVKFIYHFPPVLLLHSLKRRRVCLPLGGGGNRKGGGPRPRPSKGEKGSPSAEPEAVEERA